MDPNDHAERHATIQSVADESNTQAGHAASITEHLFNETVPQHVAILDGSGRIVSFNEAWRRFAEDADVQFAIGTSYLNACSSAFSFKEDEGSALAVAIRSVISGDAETCAVSIPLGIAEDSQNFRLRVYRLSGPGSADSIVTHAFVDGVTEARPALRSTPTQQQLRRGPLDCSARPTRKCYRTFDTNCEPP